jgi:hypothetical protein
VPVVLTDGDGRFQLSVPSGPRLIVASKAGYERREMPLQLTAESVEIRLQRGAAISGHIIDEVGEPVEGAHVVAQNATTGVTSLTAFTDDRGEYRLARLSVGRYLVSATANAGMSAVRVSDGVASFPTRRTTYYPSATVRDEAQAITVAEGDERTFVDLVIPGAQSPGPFGLIQRARSPVVHPPVAVAGSTASAVIRGKVVDTHGGSLSHAQILLSVETDGRQTLATRADDSGAFEFSELPPGRYRLMASKVGYGPVASTESADVRPPSSVGSGIRVEIADAEIREHVNIALLRWGTLSGRVVDERGDPLQGARVDALHIQFQVGRRRLLSAGSAELTDDLGRYRIPSLPPGQYIVSAAVNGVQAAELPGYSRSYYPGSADAAEAQFIRVAIDQEVTGIDVPLSPTRTARIAGQLIGAAGEGGMAGSLNLIASQRSLSIANVPMGARVQPDGRFEFTDVSPGPWVIQSSRARPNGEDKLCGDRIWPRAAQILRKHAGECVEPFERARGNCVAYEPEVGSLGRRSVTSGRVDQQHRKRRQREPESQLRVSQHVLIIG